MSGGKSSKHPTPWYWIEVSGEIHTPVALPPDTRWIGCWVSLRTGLEEKTENLGSSRQSQSLCYANLC